MADKRFEDMRLDTEGARIRGDRVLFSSSIRRGVDDAKKGEIARAQAKLVEARYYAKRDGMLTSDAEMTNRQIRNGHVAKRALKLLARDIVKAEQRLQNPLRGEGESGERYRFSRNVSSTVIFYRKDAKALTFENFTQTPPLFVEQYYGFA